MPIIQGTFLLFALNLLDALLTLVWVRSGVAAEGNQLMARTITAVVLFRWGNMRLARLGLTVALAVYLGLMGVHIFTGLSAAGLVSNAMINDLTGTIAAVAEI
jgi:hypothetical protein